jgi:uncharacterized protein (TIGR02246 family)
MVQSRGVASDESAIRKSIEDTIAAFNTRKASAILQVYTQNLDVVTTRGEHLRERDDLAGRLQGLFSRPDFSLQQRLVDLTIRFVRDDVALAHVEIEMSGAVSASGEPQPPHRELSLRVYVQEEGTWRVTAFHNTVMATL